MRIDGPDSTQGWSQHDKGKFMQLDVQFNHIMH